MIAWVKIGNGKFLSIQFVNLPIDLPDLFHLLTNIRECVRHADEPVISHTAASVAANLRCETNDHDFVFHRIPPPKKKRLNHTEQAKCSLKMTSIVTSL